MKLKSSSISKIIDLIKSKEIQRVVNNSCSYTKTVFTRKENDWIFNEIETHLPFNLFLKDYFRGCTYVVGDFMSEHIDGDYSHAHSSGGILLNSDYEGGEFMFGSEKLKAEVGEIFTFGRDVLHNVNEVKKGIRYSLHFHIMKQKSVL